MRLLARVAATCAVLLPASAPAASDGPTLFIHRGEAIGEAQRLPGGWTIQEWKSGDGAHLCVVAVGTKAASLNLVLGGGASELLVWSDTLTEGLAADGSPGTLTLTFNGFLPLDVTDLSWEYGLVAAAEVSDPLSVALMLADRVAVSLDGGTPVVIDLGDAAALSAPLAKCIVGLMR